MKATDMQNEVMRSNSIMSGCNGLYLRSKLDASGLTQQNSTNNNLLIYASKPKIKISQKINHRSLIFSYENK